MNNLFYSMRVAWLAAFVLGLLGQSGFSEEGVTKAEPTKNESQVCALPEITPDKILIKNEGELNDQNRELKDFSTKFVVDNFFTSQETLFNFVKLTYQTIDNDLKAYKAKHNLDERAVFFIFKGGNVMRLIANGIFGLLPDTAREYLQENYADIFKRSDADFGVMVDEEKLNGLDYDTVMNDLTELTYAALAKIRDVFYADPDKYFDFGHLSAEEASTLMKKSLQSLNDPNEVKSTADPQNEIWYKAKFSQYQVGNEAANLDFLCKYFGQRDVRFQFGDNKNEIVGTAITENGGPIQITINRTLEWPMKNNPNNIIKFYLVRAKIGFDLTFTKNSGSPTRKIINGELIDASLPNRADFRLRKFLDNYDNWVTDYTLKLNDNEILSFKAESIEGIAADIAEILFQQQDRPWNDPKYEKRMRRLFFFGITDILKSMGLGSEKIESYVEAIKEKVVTPLETVYVDGKVSTDAAEQIAKNASDIAESYPELSVLNHLFLDTAKLVQENLSKVSEADENAKTDEESLKAYLEVVKKNLDIIKKLSTMEPLVIDPREVYNANIDDLL